MTTDLRTMFWKEWHSLVAGRSRRQILIIVGIISLESLLFPIEMGRDWVSDPVMLSVAGIIMPLIVVGVIVPDAIAGERERHTLSTLLASRLPDRAILFGKLGFAVAIGWLTAPVILLLTLIVANLVAGSGELLLYDWGVIAAVLLAGFLVAVLTGAIGVFVSLRARTAQEAQQLTVTGLMVPIFVLSAVLMLVVGTEELRRLVADVMATLDVRVIVAAALALIAVIDLVLVWTADRRFRRSRLMHG